MFNTNRQNSKFLTDADLLSLAEKVVGRYVNAGTIPEKDKEDVKMAMVEKFLLKQDAIKSAFKGDAKITTYCIAVLNRMCCEVIRKELKYWKSSNDEISDVSTSSNLGYNQNMVICDEAKFLHRILRLFGDEYFKLKLFLAFFYQLKIKIEDINNYSKNAELESYFSNNDLKNKGDIFKQLSEVVNLAENKELKPDAIRMWLNKCIDKIISRLNEPFNRANYDRETLQILFEYYYLEVFEKYEKIKKGA